MQSNSSKQSYLANSVTNPAHQVSYSSKISTDFIPNASNHGNSSQLSGLSMSGMSENPLRQSYSKSVQKQPEHDTRHVTLNINSNSNPTQSQYQIQTVLNSQYHEGAFSQGGHQKSQQVRASKQSLGMLATANSTLPNKLHQRHEQEAYVQKNYKQSKTIFKGNDLKAQQLYEIANKSIQQSSLVSETPSQTPSKSDLNETAETKKQVKPTQKKHLQNNFSQSHLPISQQQLQLVGTGNLKTPVNKMQANMKILQKMDAVLKSKSPEPMGTSTQKLINNRAPFASKNQLHNLANSQPMIIATKMPAQIKSNEQRISHGVSNVKSQSIVCPIYPSKDFRGINPTTSNLNQPQVQYFEDSNNNYVQMKKKAMTFVSGKDRPQRSAAKGMIVQSAKNADGVSKLHNYESLIHGQFAPKAFSPEPSMNDRLTLLQKDQIEVQLNNDKNLGNRRSSTVSREATIEDVYMTQRAQKAILAGKKKKVKQKTMEQNYLRQPESVTAQTIKLAQQQNATANYFEGTEQFDMNKALKKFAKKQKKNSLTALEAETYLKMLSLSQLEKCTPSNFKQKLKENTITAYHTKLKSKSQSNGQSLKNSANSGKNRDNSASMSATSSQPPTDPKQNKRTRIRMKSIGADQSQSSNKAKSKNILRKSAISPQTPNTLQEPSAKALPTSSKVKISTKFNKFANSNDKSIENQKNKIQMLSNTQSKKNLFSKKPTHTVQNSTDKLTFQQTLSPQNKAPVIRRTSLKSSHNQQPKHESIPEQDEKTLSKKVYGLSSKDTPILFSYSLSPITQYLNQLNNQQQLSNSQLFQISQLKHSNQQIQQSQQYSNELEHSTFGKKINNYSREEVKSKRASFASKKDAENEQVLPKAIETKQIFDYELIKNFRSLSPTNNEKKPSRPNEKQVFQNQQPDSVQQLPKRFLQIKRSSLSPPPNQFFCVPRDQSPKDMQKVVVRMFPKHSPKVSPDPKTQTYSLQQLKNALSGSQSAASVIKSLNMDHKQSDRTQTSQKQYIAEMAIQNSQQIVRLARPTSNDLIKTFKMVKSKFLSPEIKVRDGMSPDNQIVQPRRSANSPHLSNGSSKQALGKKPLNKNPFTTSKVKTNSQLGHNFQNLNSTSSSRALFIKPQSQAEVVLNRIGSTKQKSIKESVSNIKNNQASSKLQRKVPIATASIALTKAPVNAQSSDMLVLQKNQQLFKKSTLQKSSIIAQAAAKKSHVRDSQDFNNLEIKQVNQQDNVDDIPMVEVVDQIKHKKSPKIDKSNMQSMVHAKNTDMFEETKNSNNQTNVKSKKQTAIGEQMFSESQKKKPILNKITEQSDIQLTPLTKGKDSFKSSIASQLGNLTKLDTCSDKEQLQFNRDLQKLIKMFKLHYKQFNQAPPTTCEFYRIGRVLGKGAFGKVNFAMHKLSEQLVAIKSMSKETLQSEDDLRRRTKLEMGILQQSNHPNVVRLFDTFETQKHICFVMELCSGGDLFSYIKKRRRLKEDVARFFFRQIIEGLAYIHNAKLVVHRDIKLENILLDATGNVKICDFGVSRMLKTEKQVMHEQCGTPAYIAPEILKDEGYHGFKVDMWSAGVCLYAMLIGSVPFKAATMAALQDLILKGQYDLKFQTSANSNKLNNPKAASTILSEDVQDLIKKMLNVDPAKRLSAVQALEHPWLKDAPTEFDVFTEKEKTLIQKEYMRLNLKKSAYNKDNGKSSRHASFSQIQETEQALFTEHNLETKNAEDEEPQQQNAEEKSYILAPFNSIKSMFIDNPKEQSPKEDKKEPFKWPDEIINMIVPRRVVKFARKCREKNRIYEQNNNADLDNGVYNEFVNEQEKEEGAMFKKDSSESEGKPSPQLSKHSDKEEESSDGDVMMKSSSSSDSLQKSFKDTELSSDEDKADRQVRQTHQDWQKNKDKEFFNIMEEEKKQEEEAIHREFLDKRTPPCVPGVTMNQKIADQKQVGPSAAQKVLAYQEKEFTVDPIVVKQIEQMNVIPRQYLLNELVAGSNLDKRQQNDRPRQRKMNYVTATYFLLVKKQDLIQIQNKQKNC